MILEALLISHGIGPAYHDTPLFGDVGLFEPPSSSNKRAAPHLPSTVNHDSKSILLTPVLGDSFNADFTSPLLLNSDNLGDPFEDTPLLEDPNLFELPLLSGKSALPSLPSIVSFDSPGRARLAPNPHDATIAVTSGSLSNFLGNEKPASETGMSLASSLPTLRGTLCPP